MAVQYKVADIPMTGYEEWLNEVGKDNWEFITYTANGRAVFMRKGQLEAEDKK